MNPRSLASSQTGRRGQDVRRDYYLVETTAGERFWLFRSLDKDSWYLHGTFA